MESDRKWIVVRIDGKYAGISSDYGRLADISARISQKCRHIDANRFNEIYAKRASFEEIWSLRGSIRWDQMMLFGTDFQIKVWKKLWELSQNRRLLSYTDFADLCDNRSGVRAVAHAIALNPLPILIPCHLVVPKEAIDRIREIQRSAELTIFKGKDLCRTSILNDNSIDFGEYALGKETKRKLIEKEFNEVMEQSNQKKSTPSSE